MILRRRQTIRAKNHKRQTGLTLIVTKSVTIESRTIGSVEDRRSGIRWVQREALLMELSKPSAPNLMTTNSSRMVVEGEGVHFLPEVAGDIMTKGVVAEVDVAEDAGDLIAISRSSSSSSSNLSSLERPTGMGTVLVVIGVHLLAMM